MTGRHPIRGGRRNIQTAACHRRILAALERRFGLKDRLDHPERETWRCIWWGLVVLGCLTLGGSGIRPW